MHLCACAVPSVLCRDEAQKLWAERAALEAVGLKVVCVVHEWIDREVREAAMHAGAHTRVTTCVVAGGDVGALGLSSSCCCKPQEMCG